MRFLIFVRSEEDRFFIIGLAEGGCFGWGFGGDLWCRWIDRWIDEIGLEIFENGKMKHTFPIRHLLAPLIQGQRVDRAAAARGGQDGLVGDAEVFADSVT